MEAEEKLQGLCSNKVNHHGSNSRGLFLLFAYEILCEIASADTPHLFPLSCLRGILICQSWKIGCFETVLEIHMAFLMLYYSVSAYTLSCIHALLGIEIRLTEL